MDFSLDDDHVALRDAVQRFCDGEYPAQNRGNPQFPDEAAARWRAMADLGLLGLPFDPEHGGSGLGAIELMLVAQEFGRSLGGHGWLASVVLAAQMLAAAGSPQQRSRWLPALTRGEARMALAFGEAETRYSLTRIATTAGRVDGGWRIDGRKALVLDGDSADLLLVVARTAGAPDSTRGLTVFGVEARMPGVSVQPFATLDGRRAAHIEFNAVTVDDHAIVGTAGEAFTLLEAALDRAAAVSCAEAAGACEALLDQCTEHLRTRKQFGAPLAKFQALQHRVADMLIAVEQLKSMACAAAMAVAADEPGQRARIVSAAKLLTGQLGRRVALDAIQLHGAMGMTDECRVGHYAKRLLVLGQWFGDAGYHLQRLADQNTSAIPAHRMPTSPTTPASPPTHGHPTASVPEASPTHPAKETT